MPTSNPATGAGTRPTTDSGVDNIGAGESFRPGAAPGTAGPAPREKMTLKRSDAQAVEDDDSAPFYLKESADKTRPDDRTPKPA